MLGDLNVAFLSSAASTNGTKLTEILDIYGLSQMINQHTQITVKSSTLIDLCITSAPANVVNSGVMHLSISDHSLVYMIQKGHYVRDGVRRIETRTMKTFNSENFLRDLEQRQWHNVYCSNDLNEMWKSIRMETVDKHAPLRSRRISSRKSLWVTNEACNQTNNAI